MLGLAEIQAAFPKYTELAPLGVTSGQKDVLSGRKGTQRVALKLIKSSQDKERTIREIEAVARLSSDFVPMVIEHGTRVVGGDARLFLVEQFIEGESYREWLNIHKKPPLEFVLGLAATLLRACCDFEDANLVHRDIKPENIMIGADGKIWIIDFGIVRILDQISLTATGQHFGPCTPGYGAPEQVRNLKTQIGIRADLFSVGVVLYESLHGVNPYLIGKRDALEVVRGMAQFDLPALPGIDAELGEFIGSLAARFPSRRPQNAREAITWFEPIRLRLATQTSDHDRIG